MILIISQNCSMFPLAFIAGWLQGHWWGFISWNYVVWPTFLLMNVFIALKGSHFWFLFEKCNCKFEPRHDKTNKVVVHPAKTQISLVIRPVWSKPSLCVHWVAKDPTFLHADSEDSDKTGRMPRLIWVFVGRRATLLVLSFRGKCVVILEIVQRNEEIKLFCTVIFEACE